ncbi:MAG: hypothetical protein AB7U63_15445 [Porticoccaceae bacterium]
MVETYCYGSDPEYHQIAAIIQILNNGGDYREGFCALQLSVARLD